MNTFVWSTNCLGKVMKWVWSLYGSWRLSSPLLHYYLAKHEGGWWWCASRRVLMTMQWEWGSQLIVQTLRPLFTQPFIKWKVSESVSRYVFLSYVLFKCKTFREDIFLIFIWRWDAIKMRRFNGLLCKSKEEKI